MFTYDDSLDAVTADRIARDLEADEAMQLIEGHLAQLHRQWEGRVASVAADTLLTLGHLERHARRALAEYRDLIARIERDRVAELDELASRLRDLGVPDGGIDAALGHLRRENRIHYDGGVVDHDVARLTPQEVIEWTAVAAGGGVIGNLSYDALKIAWRQGRPWGIWRLFSGAQGGAKAEGSLPEDALDWLARLAVAVRCREQGLATPKASDLRVKDFLVMQVGYVANVEWRGRSDFSAQVTVPYKDLRRDGIAVVIRMSGEA